MPGVFTQQDKGSGVLAVNIRGDSGLGRVNTMVDGVTQTFYSTSADAGRSGSSSQFGTALDPNFIAGVDVTKGSFSGANGINTLSRYSQFPYFTGRRCGTRKQYLRPLDQRIDRHKQHQKQLYGNRSGTKRFDSGARLVRYMVTATVMSSKTIK